MHELYIDTKLINVTMSLKILLLIALGIGNTKHGSWMVSLRTAKLYCQVNAKFEFFLSLFFFVFFFSLQVSKYNAFVFLSLTKDFMRHVGEVGPTCYRSDQFK